MGIHDPGMEYWLANADGEVEAKTMKSLNDMRRGQ